jgi:MFS family permease
VWWKRKKAESAPSSLGAAALAELPDEVRSAVIGSYYPRQIATADSARSRAQAAYTVASGIALAILAAGVFTDIAHQRVLVRYLAAGTVALWLLTAFAFLLAVGGPPPPHQGTDIESESEFVRHVLSTARSERDWVDSRLRLAYWPTAAAMVLTVVTFVAAATSRVSESSARIVLTQRGLGYVAQFCPEAGLRLRGGVDLSSLSDPWVFVRMKPSVCGTESELRLRSQDIAVIAFDRR